MTDDQEARREIARALAALRRRVTVPCVVCGTPVTGATHRRYCSAACRTRAYRQRLSEHDSDAAREKERDDES